MTENGNTTEELTKTFRDWLHFVVTNAPEERLHQDVKFIFEQYEQALQRLELKSTFKHHSGADMPCLPDPAETPLGQIYKQWAEEKGLDQFGNLPSDYTNTGSVVDTYHARSIGWKPPEYD